MLGVAVDDVTLAVTELVTVAVAVETCIECSEVALFPPAEPLLDWGAVGEVVLLSADVVEDDDDGGEELDSVVEEDNASVLDWLVEEGAEVLEETGLAVVTSSPT